MQKISSILIIKPSALGDIVHALPVLPELRKLYPGVKICWLVFEHFAGILEGNKYLDGLVVWRRKDKSFSHLRELIREIRSHKFDVVIDLQGLARTAAIALLSGAKLRLGVPGLREFSYLFEKETGVFDPGQHAVERNLTVIKYFGALPGAPQFDIAIPEEDEKYAADFLARHNYDLSKPLVGFLCGAGIKQKMWPAENFASLAGMITEKLGARVLFFGSSKETLCVNAVLSAMGPESAGNTINAAGETTLKQLCALLRKCRIVVGNDTGPLHMAAALGVMPVGLFGPSSPGILAPYHPDAVYFYKKLDCSPCGIRPTCRDVRCMKEINVEEVFEAVKLKWKK